MSPWTPTSSTNWARTHWSWRSSAPGFASSRTCQRCPSRTSTRTQRSRRWPRPWHRRKRRRHRCKCTTGWRRCSPTCWTSSTCRWRPTSSRTWARTRWSWRGSAPGSASSRTCQRCPSRTSTRTQRFGAGCSPGTGGRGKAQVQVQDRLAEVLSGVLDIEHVPVDADFFQDLGADSLVMAQFCARVRKQPDLPAVSIKDIYQNPTISALVASLAPAEEASAQVQVQERLAGTAGRRAGRRARARGRQLLPRPGRGLAGHGEVLRPGPQGAGPAGGVHQGRLPQPEGRCSRRGSWLLRYQCRPTRLWLPVHLPRGQRDRKRHPLPHPRRPLRTRRDEGDTGLSQLGECRPRRPST